MNKKCTCGAKDKVLLDWLDAQGIVTAHNNAPKNEYLYTTWTLKLKHPSLSVREALEAAIKDSK